MARHKLTRLGALLTLTLMSFAAPASVHAECTFNVIPPATEAARSAREIIVGRVIESIDDYEYDFRIRIIHVLCGPAHVGELRRFNNVYPGWPLSQYPIPGTTKHYPPCSPITGRQGHVIAFALDALASDGVTRYNAASLISGFNAWGLPRTTLAEMERLAALPQTDTVPVSSADGDRRKIQSIAVVALIGLIGFVVSLKRPRRFNRL